MQRGLSLLKKKQAARRRASKSCSSSLSSSTSSSLSSSSTSTSLPVPASAPASRIPVRRGSRGGTMRSSTSPSTSTPTPASVSASAHSSNWNWNPPFVEKINSNDEKHPSRLNRARKRRGCERRICNDRIVQATDGSARCNNSTLGNDDEYSRDMTYDHNDKYSNNDNPNSNDNNNIDDACRTRRRHPGRPRGQRGISRHSIDNGGGREGGGGERGIDTDDEDNEVDRQADEPLKQQIMQQMPSSHHKYRDPIHHKQEHHSHDTHHTHHRQQQPLQDSTNACMYTHPVLQPQPQPHLHPHTETENQSHAHARSSGVNHAGAGLGVAANSWKGAGSSVRKVKMGIEWRCNECDKECMGQIRSQSWCMCGHRFKGHKEKVVTLKGRDGKLRKKVTFPCSNSKCKCKHYFYIVAQGSWMLRCRCKHKHVQHDPSPGKHACTRPKCDCAGFDSPWVCNCDHPWAQHTQRVVKREGKSMLELMQEAQELFEVQRGQESLRAGTPDVTIEEVE